MSMNNAFSNQDFADIATSLDRLGAADRASANGLESRVFAASAAALTHNAPALKLVGVEQPRVVVRAFGWRLRVGFAAAAAVVVAGFTVVSLQQNTSKSNTLAGATATTSTDGVDSFLSVLAVVDSGTLNERIDGLVSDESSISNRAKTSDVLSDTTDQGAM